MAAIAERLSVETLEVEIFDDLLLLQNCEPQEILSKWVFDDWKTKYFGATGVFGGVARFGLGKWSRAGELERLGERESFGWSQLTVVDLPVGYLLEDK